LLSTKQNLSLLTRLKSEDRLKAYGKLFYLFSTHSMLTSPSNLTNDIVTSSITIFPL